jgi:XRE family transcriptional regulator, regulator of sulfur utilization
VREPVDQTLADVFKQLREERGLTQEDVAFAADLTVSGLGRIERGQTSPGWMTIRRLAEALDVSLVDLSAAVERTEG